jgi:protein phosphatase
MMKLTIEAVCQKGPKRDNNEDMVSLGGILLRDADMSFPVEIDESSQFYLLVADGMGGHEHGERASQGLLEYLDECFKENRFHADTIEDDLRFQVKTFSDRLNEEAREEGQVRPMGCTLTGMVWSHGKALLINAGDSRTYRLRDGILRRITQDDTARGITGDPNESPYLLNCIGGGANGDLMVVDFTERLHDGDLLLICSDGLTEMVPDETIEDILSSSEHPAQELHDTACANGGIDNISVIVAKIYLTG